MSRTDAPDTRAGAATAPLGLGFSPGAWLALFRHSVLQIVRGKRLLALAALFLLPTALAVVARYQNPQAAEQRDETEMVVVFYMIPQALIPLTALVLASGMVRDEQEAQTLTYLMIRPLPRPSLYLAKLLAAWAVSSALAAVFVTAALATVQWGAEPFWGTVVPGRAAQLAVLSSLSLLVYTSLFGALSLVLKWVLPVGVAYIVLFEGVFANIDFIVRRLTVLWYVRVLAERWFGLAAETWEIDLDQAPSSTEALLTLGAAALVLAAGAAWLFGSREIRVKTPEGE